MRAVALGSSLSDHRVFNHKITLLTASTTVGGFLCSSVGRHPLLRHENR